MIPVCLCCGDVLRALRRLLCCWNGLNTWFVGGLCSGGVGCDWCFVGGVDLALFGCGRRLSCFSRYT